MVSAFSQILPFGFQQVNLLPLMCPLIITAGKTIGKTVTMESCEINLRHGHVNLINFVPIMVPKMGPKSKLAMMELASRGPMCVTALML
mmetsp:Transcript_57708/g.105433  ORF Transcript_57708/g.105433 Transcript_57708/m.105433 type:complete len:89 (+) Transcript_57708:422-688(+)